VAVVTGEQDVELTKERCGDPVAMQQGLDRRLDPVTTTGRVSPDPVVAAEKQVQAVLVAERERELVTELPLPLGRSLGAEFGGRVVAQDKALGLGLDWLTMPLVRMAGSTAPQQELRTRQVTCPSILTQGRTGTGWIRVSIKWGAGSGRPEWLVAHTVTQQQGLQ
jgi:hypothetical protein